MDNDFKQIAIAPFSRGIVDYFICFVCDEYQWECEHLVDDRLTTARVAALEWSKLRSFAYDGQRRTLEIEFRVGADEEWPRVLVQCYAEMFERFTEKARRCIFFARKTATKYGSPTIETEHLLLGILHEDAKVIGRFLAWKTAKEIRAEVENRLTKTDASTLGETPLSNPCKRILAYAAEEAERLHHRLVGVGQLLAGMIREQEGMACEILRSAGLNVADMRQRMSLNEPRLNKNM